MTTKRIRPEMYGKYVSVKRKRYEKDGKCIDCGEKSESIRCDQCCSKATAYMRKWRKNNLEHAKELQKQWRLRNPEKDKIKQTQYRIKRKYDLTLEEYKHIITEPCGICGGTKKMSLDHCHTTGKIRGALCINCNGSLGWFEKYSQQVNDWIKFQGKK